MLLKLQAANGLLYSQMLASLAGQKTWINSNQKTVIIEELSFMKLTELLELGIVIQKHLPRHKFYKMDAMEPSRIYLVAEQEDGLLKQAHSYLNRMAMQEADLRTATHLAWEFRPRNYMLAVNGLFDMGFEVVKNLEEVVGLKSN